MNGSAAITRVSVSADYAVTSAFTPKFRIVDEFRSIYFQIPGQNNPSTSALFASSMAAGRVVFSPATCSPHNASPKADASHAIFSLFPGQDVKFNMLEFEYAFTKRAGGLSAFVRRLDLISSGRLIIRKGQSVHPAPKILSEEASGLRYMGTGCLSSPICRLCSNMAQQKCQIARG